MTGSYPAFLDANVLHPALLRNVLMHLALADFFDARWSDAVHAEWIRSVLRRFPALTQAKLERTRALMEANLPDANVTGYEPLIGQLTLPDADDRHVLAAAIHCGARVIVTENLKHFPAAACMPHGIIVQSADAFVLDRLQQDIGLAVATLHDMRVDLTSPPYTAAELLAVLARQGLKATVAALQAHVDVL